jgi:DHA2 family multidrug resistance protein
MFAMMFAGRMALRIDPRLLMTLGTSALLWSMWEMSTWTPQVNNIDLMVVTFIQGFGMGFVFVPMNLTAFATMPSQFRTDGSALSNLVRNIGSAIGVSFSTAVLGGSVQTMHSMLAHYASPFNRALGVNGPAMMMNPQIPFGLQTLNGLIELRAEIAGFANDFLFMFYISLPALLIIWLMRRPNLLAMQPVDKVEVTE